MMAIGPWSIAPDVFNCDSVMLGLTLREGFRGQHLPPTAISLVEPDGSSAQ